MTIKRWCLAGLLALLLSGVLVSLIGAAPGVLPGAFTTGTDTNGHHYGFYTLSGAANVTSVTVTFAAATASAAIQCDVPAPNPHHGVGNPNDPFEWQSVWSLSHPTGTVSVNATCTTQWVRVDVGSAPVPTAMSVNGTLSGTSTATATAVSPTATMVTATGTSMPVMNTCGDLGDGAVDQNGISVDVWAPGKRTACGFAGYENGDNPMPAGTPLPPPRPFRFDYAVDHHEPVFGFKVFYRQGDANHCGDVRMIIHQGGDTHGFDTRFHTFQYAEAVCDSKGVKHIIDIGGQIDTGTLYPRSLPDSGRPSGPNRLTADIISCNPAQNQYICATVWYMFYTYNLPGGAQGFVHLGSLVENPIALLDPNDHSRVVPGPGNGTTTMMRDLQRYVPAHSTGDWWVMFDPTSGVQTVVPAGTTGAWQDHVDTWFSEYQVLEHDGIDHPHAVSGIAYPN